MSAHRLLAGVLLALSFALPPTAHAQNDQSCVAAARIPTYRPDLDTKWFGCDGQLRWPPNDGFAGAPVNETLPPGTVVDRYGSEYGHFFATVGAPCETRALPYDCAKLPYTKYRLLQPLHVQAGPAAPWFDEPGGAMQFETAESALQLKQEGVLEPAQ